MKKNLILFNSMTSAMKSREVLKKQGIFSRIIKTPAEFRKRSCGYSLLVNKDMERAVDIIKANKIQFVGVAATDLR